MEHTSSQCVGYVCNGIDVFQLQLLITSISYSWDIYVYIIIYNRLVFLRIYVDAHCSFK